MSKIEKPNICPCGSNDFDLKLSYKQGVLQASVSCVDCEREGPLIQLYAAKKPWESMSLITEAVISAVDGWNADFLQENDDGTKKH